MIKTTYQTPELRDANDNVVQEGSFGKNTALSNSTNDGWIDYVMNDLEALHDTIGDSAPTLDGNGRVVEPANLAIGDEDGLRIKNNYLKLSGGNVTGIASFRTDLRMLDNQDNRFGGLYVPASSSTQQYLQLYGGTRATGDAMLTLYPSGDGHFQLLAYSNDGSNSYALQSDNAGNLNWRGYPLAWKKDYLPLSGGMLSGGLQFSSQSGRIQMNRSSSNNDGNLAIYGGSGYSTGAYLWLNGAGRASQAGCFGIRAVADGSTSKELQGRPDGTLTWGGYSVALAKDYLPLAGGTMTGDITFNKANPRVVGARTTGNLGLYAGTNNFDGANLQLFGRGDSTYAGMFYLRASNKNSASDSGGTVVDLVGRPNGILTWNGTQLAYETSAIRAVSSLASTSGSNTATFEMRGNSALVAVKRGANAQLFMCDYWTANSVTLSSVGSAIATVTKTANSNTVTITNTSSLAVSVQIVSGANLL